jgi:hypothetical protein
MVEGQVIHVEQPEPVPVRVVGTEETRPEAPEYGSWTSIQFAGAEKPVQILPFNTKRAQAVIMIGAGAAGNTNGKVFVGSRAQVDNPQAAAWLTAGQSITVKNRQQLFMVPDGVNSLSVTWLDERQA